MEEIINKLTNYIAAWGWHLTAMMFLIGCMIMIALPANLSTAVFSISFLIMFFACEFMALKRKMEVYEDE